MRTKHWVFIVIIGLWLGYHALRLTKVFFAVSMVSTVNAPTLNQYSIHFCSKLKEPERFSFAAFRNRKEPGQPLWIFRVCGMAGDTIAIKNGVLFINGENADRTLTLGHHYVMRVMDTADMDIPEFSTTPLGTDSLIVSLADTDVTDNNWPSRKYILAPEHVDALIQKRFGSSWNQDHFGPFIVPPSSYFLLGDNRLDAIDSRYIGCVDKKDIVGCLVF